MKYEVKYKVNSEEKSMTFYSDDQLSIQEIRKKIQTEEGQKVSIQKVTTSEE